MALDPYEQLGVERTATAADIKSAWRSKAQQMHPDKHPGDPYAETRFAQIRESYDILSDPARRSAFDSDGSTKRDDLPVRAKMLIELVAHGLLTAAETSPNLGNIDLVLSLRASIEKTLEMKERERPAIEYAMRGLEKQLKRVHRKSRGENLLGTLIAVRVDAARGKLKAVSAQIEECRAALAMLDDYEDLNLWQPLVSWTTTI